ncbi:MAG: ChaN family lipoprotein [Rhodothermia bacterium]|nr:MAG: ChaN family lipoprotein [Rhodothermia bacterium]
MPLSLYLDSKISSTQHDSGIENNMKLPQSLAAVLAIVFSFNATTSPAAAQDSSPGVGDSLYVPGEYRIFTGDGSPATMEDIAAAMSQSQVVFIGETHDDPTGHMIEFELLKKAYEISLDAGDGEGQGRTVALSLEFFQNDVQRIVDEYLADLITEKAFLADSRPWPRYKTDYRPLVEFSKENGLAVIAANAPRRYANRATRLGRESLGELDEEARRFLPPLPYGEPSKAYRDQWIQAIMEVMEEEKMKCGKPIVAEPAEEGAEKGEADQAPPAGAHSNLGNQLHSQVLWDASMAYRVSEYLAANPDALVLHMVGSFHVARGTGAPEHLEAYRPGTSSMTVVIRPVEDVEAFEQAPSGTWGDFVIQTDESHTLEAIECAST